MVLSLRTSFHPLSQRLLVVCVPFLCVACAPALLPLTAPTSAEIPRLEAQLAGDPVDIGVRVRLAEAQRRAGQPDAAARLLEPVAAAEPTAAFFLGLVREDQERFADARQLYSHYLARAGRTELSRRVRDRLALLGRLELQHAVRSALAQEQELAATPSPYTVGVFPFLTISDDPALRPLGTALAELLTTDLAQTNRMTVLERAQLQLLLDEMRLGEAERVDPATAARSGRLLGAGTIVQGRVEGARAALSLEAAVLRVPADTAPGDPLRERDALERFLELEKRLALAIYDRLGIALTPAERQRVTRHATGNVQALLAFGFGLEAQDGQRYDDAAAQFRRALELDAGFRQARERLAEAEAQARAAGADRAQLGLLGLQEAERRRLLGMFQVIELLVIDPAGRDPAAEALGTEGATRQGTAEIIIRRPGGTP